MFLCYERIIIVFAIKDYVYAYDMWYVSVCLFYLLNKFNLNNFCII